MSTEPLIYSEMRLQQVGTLVFIQPVQNSAVAGPSLTVELGTGTVGLAEHSVPLKGTATIYGVIGLARFLGGCALAVITDAEQVRPLMQPLAFSCSVIPCTCSERAVSMLEMP